MSFGTLRGAAIFMFAATALHLAMALWTGSTDLVLAGLALVAGLVFLAGWRGPAWIVMLALIVALGAEIARIGDNSLPAALIWAIVVIDACAVIASFVAIWRSPKATAGADQTA